jgi:hypothetical protein
MNAQQETPRSADLEQAIKHQIVQRTNGRIRALEVEVVANHVEVRGFASSFHLKQLAIQGSFEAIASSGSAPVELDVRIRVEQPVPVEST